MSIYDINGAWFHCSKSIVSDETLSQSAKWLYVVLSCLNNTYGKAKGIFTRTNKDLMKDSGLSEKTLQKAKNELINAGYIKAWNNHLYNNSEHTKLTTFRICYYQILK